MLPVLASIGLTPRALLSVLKLVKTAALHCQWTVRPDVGELKRPLQVAGLIPPGRLPVTGKTRPARNVLPGRPGWTTVTQVLVVVSKLVVAVLTLGEMVIVAFGTARLKDVLFAVNWIVDWSKLMVTGLVRGDGNPVTLNTLLNHMKR